MQQVAFSTIARTGIPSFAFDQINEREDKIIGKKEIKTEYDPDDEDDVGFDERQKAKSSNLSSMYDTDDNIF